MIRKFRWKNDNDGVYTEDGLVIGFDYDTENDVMRRVFFGGDSVITDLWSIEKLERFAADPNDTLNEVTERTFKVHTTKVITFNGDVISREQAKLWYDELALALQDTEEH